MSIDTVEHQEGIFGPEKPLIVFPIRPIPEEYNLPKMEKLPQTFFDDTWPELLGTTYRSEPSEISNTLETMHDEMKPALDAYIDKYNLPIEKNPGETDVEFFNRAVSAMFNLNEKNIEHKGWKDCWPSTAIEIGRTNCALGSLILAHILEKAGFEESNLQYGFPGPMSHAVVIVETVENMFYLDQTNGIVAKVAPGENVDGIETVTINPANESEKEKIPYRTVPVTKIANGVAPIIWNLGSMQRREGPDNEGLATRFNLSPDMNYSTLGRDLLGPNWNQKQMLEQETWANEKTESDNRINNGD